MTPVILTYAIFQAYIVTFLCYECLDEKSEYIFGTTEQFQLRKNDAFFQKIIVSFYAIGGPTYLIPESLAGFTKPTETHCTANGNSTWPRSMALRLHTKRSHWGLKTNDLILKMRLATSPLALRERAALSNLNRCDEIKIWETWSLDNEDGVLQLLHLHSPLTGLTFRRIPFYDGEEASSEVELKFDRSIDYHEGVQRPIHGLEKEKWSKSVEPKHLLGVLRIYHHYIS
ncbi:hypothetical protein PROFUN_16926 [Planoprotostelium fungivorum]|uniref:Uncharacterized protein n=1 Tax=Planoprotostelium fungivorum TaxID=1890364 RepID=A0A2P6MN47_9EUKA|nr:hypothetical protein PROFUN_16926 [Planoprotostelium fungivorum]